MDQQSNRNNNEQDTGHDNNAGASDQSNFHLGIADTFIVNCYDFFRNQLFREPNPSTVRELSGYLTTNPHRGSAPSDSTTTQSPDRPTIKQTTPTSSKSSGNKISSSFNTKLQQSSTSHARDSSKSPLNSEGGNTQIFSVQDKANTNESSYGDNYTEEGDDNLSVDSSSRKRSTFYQNYVKHKLTGCKKGTTVDTDVNAWKNFKNYPNGSVSIYYEDIRKPQIFWAQENVSGAKGYKCLGIWVCPQEGCLYRFRPRAPRRGKDKYNTGGKMPAPEKKNQCKEHQLPLSHVSCTCTWKLVKSFEIVQKQDTSGSPEASKEGRHNGWYCHHVGDHNHPATFPQRATYEGTDFLHNVVSVNPTITTTQLQAGNVFNDPISKLDIRFPTLIIMPTRIELKAIKNEKKNEYKAYDSFKSITEANSQISRKSKVDVDDVSPVKSKSKNSVRESVPVQVEEEKKNKSLVQ